MRIIGKSCVMLLLLITARSSQAEEPKFFVEKNLDQGKLYQADTAGGSEPVKAAPAPPLRQEEIDAALSFDTELVEQVVRQLSKRREEGESAIRRLPSLSPEERDALREEYGLLRRSAMTREEAAFNRALEGARYGKPELVLDYLGHGGKVDHPATDREYRLRGATLLTNAVLGNQLTIVQLLLDQGADVNLPGDLDIPPVETAADDDRLPVLKALLDRGARLGRNVRDNTPLWKAANHGEVGAIKLLISYGANPNEPGNYGELPLSRAAGNGYTEAVRALLAGGARINASDKDGTTALHSAILGSLEVVQILVEHGADVNQVDGEGSTPLDFANTHRRYEIGNYLRSHGALSAGDLLRQAWVATRPPSTALAPRPRTLRAPCAKETSTEGLASLWNDPEYQSFLKRLSPWVPPLEPGETSGSTAGLITAGWSAMSDFVQNSLPSILGAQGNPDNFEFDVPALLRGGRRMLVISGYLLSDKDHLANLTGDQLFATAAMLQLSLVPTYVGERRALGYERARELYDLMLTASDLFSTLIPCDSLSQDNRMTAGFLSQLMAMTTPPVRPLDALPPTARDFERLRARLDPWLEQTGVDARTYLALGGGLPGHLPAAQADAFLRATEGKLPYLVLYYRPDDYRGKSFSCTPFEGSLVGSGRPDICSAEEVEIRLLSKLADEADRTGEALDEKRRYETFFIFAFLVRHHGDVMERQSPGLRSEFIEWASGFVQSLDLINRLDTDLSPIEVTAKEFAMKKFQNPRRARELYTELRELFSY